MPSVQSGTDLFRFAEREGLGRNTEPQQSFALTAVARLQRSYHHIRHNTSVHANLLRTP